MDALIIYVLLLAFFELYESTWQSAPTLGEMLHNIYTRYERSVFYLILSHPSFIYVLYLGIKFDLSNFWFLSILFFKFLDISFKLVIAQKMQQRRLAEVLPLPLETPIQKWMAYLNVVLYPALLYVAFLQG